MNWLNRYGGLLFLATLSIAFIITVLMMGKVTTTEIDKKEFIKACLNTGYTQDECKFELMKVEYGRRE